MGPKWRFPYLASRVEIYYITVNGRQGTKSVVNNSMSSEIFSSLRGDGLGARVTRGAALTFVSFGGAQALRLASNLILTRLLFPDVFGLMALVQVFMFGLEMFSDTGIAQSIIQNERGDDPAFLDTAWTIQILRGIFLWLMACALAGPAAAFYKQDMLLRLLPVVGLNSLIIGFISTRMATTNRHLMLGRLTILELGSQLLGILVMILLVFWWRSVWGLVIGGLVSSICRVVLSHTFLSGHRNHLFWEKAAFQELFTFGKYIFVSSIAGFMINSGDRAILGKIVTLSELAVYNIGFFLATVPVMLNRQFAAKVMLPLYSARPPADSIRNRRHISKARFILTGSLFTLSLGLGLTGDWLVQFLYTPSYHLAGPLLVLLSVSTLPVILTGNYANLLLAAGNSKSFTLFVVVIASVQTLALLIGVQSYGLIGAVVAPVISTALTYPLLIFLIQKYKGWDPVHDAVFVVLAILGTFAVLEVNDTSISQVLQGYSQ